MEKYINFKELKDTRNVPCYQIRNNKNEYLGDLYFEKLTTKSKYEYIFYPVEGTLKNYIYWNIDCLEQLVEFIKKANEINH